MQLGVMDFCQSKCILHANKTFLSGFDVTATVVVAVVVVVVVGFKQLNSHKAKSSAPAVRMVYHYTHLWY